MSVNIYGYRLNSALKPMLKKIKSIVDNNENAIVLVPEHYTLQAEKDLMYGLHLHGLFNVEVLSPKRLQTRIIESNPFIPNDILELSGEAIAISRIAENCNNDLKYYKDCFKNTGVYTELVKFLNNLYSNGIQSEQIDEYIDNLDNDALKNKWQDINILYKAYVSLDNSKFLLNADKSKIIAESINYYKHLKGNQIFVYGFDALSFDLISLLIKTADIAKNINLYVALRDGKARDLKIYSLMRSSIEQLCSGLKEKHISYEYKFIDEIDTQTPKAFGHLLDELYSNPLANKSQKYIGKQDNIYVFEAKNPHEEATFVSDKIYNLATKNKVELSKIAIMLPTNSDNEFLLDSALRNRGISFYNAESYNISNHAVVKYLLNSLKAISDNSSIEPIIELLNNNLCALNFDEQSFLKNYIIENGIKRSHFVKEFKRGSEESKQKANTLRKKLIDPLEKLKSELEYSSDIGDMIFCCIKFIEDSNSFKKINNDDDKLSTMGFLRTSEQSDQVIKMMEVVFEQLGIVTEGEKITLVELSNFLEYGFAMSEINILPPLKNSVIIGPLDHILVNDIDYLFIMGFNDSFLTPASTDLFSDFELMQFSEETSVSLSLSKEEKNNLNNLHLKKALTLSQKELYISFSKQSILGEEAYPNSLISELQNRYFEKINVVEIYSDDLNRLLSEYRRLMLSYDFYPASEQVQLLQKIATIKSQLFKNGLSKSYLNNILTANPPEKINESTAKKLFRSKSTSVSKLEKYASCPFKYYLEYGISPKIIEPWEQNARDTGTFYHSVMESVSKKMRDKIDFSRLNEDEVINEINNIIDTSNLLQNESIYNDTKRNTVKYQNNVKKNILFSAKTFVDQMNQSMFETIQEEFRFNKDKNPFSICLNDGTEIFFSGSIDRIDECDDGETKYLRIIDYKSSNKDFDPSKLYYGIQLQLLIYMSVALNVYKDALPAGTFYFYIHLPWIDKKDKDAREELRMSGLVLKNIDAIKLMDNNTTNPLNTKTLLLKETSKSKKSNDSTQSDDKIFRSNASLLTEEEFEKLMNHALNRAKYFASQINDGNIKIMPLNDNGKLPCEYCDYSKICIVDGNEKGLQKISFSELLEKI